MNKLTQEQLDMINRLQPFFNKEKIGPVQYGDDYAVEVLPGQWEIETQGIKKKGFNDYCTTLERARQGYNVLFIPKVFDWGQPQRSLWCMVDWTKFYLEESHGTVDVHKNTDEILCMEADPFTALLKILCEQEGV